MNQIQKLIRKSGKPLVVLLGATASGKTGASIEIAKKYGGEIVSADSRQVYRHMDIGTAKIQQEEMDGIPHHLLDVVNPDERFTARDFKEKAEAEIDDILARGKLPILVGGTGLYIDVVTRNFKLAPEDPKLRAELEREFAQNGAQALHSKLEKLDPESAAKYHPNNARYIIRALEIAMRSAPPIGLRQGGINWGQVAGQAPPLGGQASGDSKIEKMAPPKYDVLKIGYKWDRKKLYERINARAEEQVSNGLFEETAKLLEMGYSPDLPSMSSLGYRESIQFLDGEISREKALALIQRNCRNYARRQMTWFRRYDDIEWIERS